MKNRLDIISRQGTNSMFISVHQNKFTQSEYFGAQIFYNENNPDNRMIAQIMQDNFKKIQPGNDRQIKLSGDELYLFKNTQIPADNMSEWARINSVAVISQKVSLSTRSYFSVR